MFFEEERQELEVQLAQHEDFRRAQTALKTLPGKYQEVLALRYFEQKTVAQIAEILGKNEGTVKSLLSRGIAKIQSIVKPQ